MTTSDSQRSPASWKRTFLKVNGVTLHVVEAGPLDGPLVVLLHGFPEFWYGWRHQIDALAGAGYRVMVPDQRGYNLSEKPHGVPAYDIDALTRDVTGLLDARGRQRAFIVGHDWGAAVAWSVAIKHPKRVEKLVILDVPHPSVFGQSLRSDPEQRRRSWYMFFFQVPVVPELLARLGRWGVLQRWVRSSARRGTFTDEDMLRYREAWSQPGAFHAMLNWYRAAFRGLKAAQGEWPVRVPTLILWGGRDSFLGADLAEKSARHCQDVRVKVFADATHWLQHEEAEQVTAELLEFFQRD